MVGHLVRLKLRLSRNRLRKSGPLGIIGFALIWIGALATGAIVGVGAFALARVFGPAGLAAVWVALAMAWLVGPLVAAALDETLEPRRLELLPIAPFPLVVGLLAAAAIGPGALATVLVILLSLLGIGLHGAQWLIGLLAGAALLGWCLASSRLVTTLLSDLLRTRRGRDVATLAVALMAGVAAFGSQAFRPSSPSPVPLDLPALEELAYTPPGALANAIGNLVFEGDIVRAGLFLGYGLAAILLVVWLWSLALQRLTTRAPSSGTARRTGEGAVFIPLALRWLRLPPQVVATAAKELKGVRRDPRMRSQFIGIGIAMLTLLVGSSRFVVGTDFAPLLAVIGGWVGVSGSGFNQFGVDDRTFWAYVCSGVSLRKVLAGKNLALVALGIPLAVILGVAGAIFGGALHTLPLALMAALAVMGVWLAVGSNTSVLGPFPLPESNMFGNRNLPGSAFTASIGGLLAAGSLSLPIGLLVGLPWFFFGYLAGLAGSAVALVYGAVIYRFGFKLAGDQLESRSLRILEILDKDSR